MRKLLIVFALVGIIFVSGCIGDTTGQVIAEIDDSATDVIQHNGECRRDTDCMLVHCRNVDEYHCMSSVQMLREMRCEDMGGLIAEKDYVQCGCVEGICKTIK